MTAAEILRNAQPPMDDGLIEKALSDLDAKIGEWTESLRSAQTQLRGAFAPRPIVPGQRPSAALFDAVPRTSLSEAAAAAHVPPPPPLPDWSKLATEAVPPPTPPTWSTPPAVPQAPPAWQGQPAAPAAPAWGAPVAPAPPAWGQPQTAPPAWGQPPAGAPMAPPAWGAPPAAGGAEWNQAAAQFAPPSTDPSSTGVMPWPSANAGPTTVSWPDASGSSTGAQQWPTWTPTDASASPAAAKPGSPTQQGGVRATKAPKATRQAVPEGPTPEERAAKAAAEEALLAELDEAIARRVRLLRRLDPDTPIEKLIDKATQGHAEAAAATPPKDDKSSGSSWWRRK